MRSFTGGNLPPRQTVEGFFAGESIPVNQALSDVFIKLHITEHTGRGVPRITEAYGKDVIRFNENSIVVTIPFERLGAEVYEGGKMNPPIIPPVEDEIPLVSGQIPPVEDEIPLVSGQIPQVEGEIPQVNPQVEKEIPQVNVSVDDKILNFCMIAKSMLEIADHLGMKDRKNVRKYLNPLIDRSEPGCKRD